MHQIAVGRPVHVDTLRWNQRLSKAFDVTAEQFPPRSSEEALVGKYLGVEIKLLERRVTRVPSVRMGAFLTAVHDVLQKWAVDDVRNLDWQGKETPPLYEVIQLNSTKSHDFLVNGMRFLRQGDVEGGVRATLRVEPRWYGVDLTTYGLRTAGTAERLIGEITSKSREINFLKGEAFALSGEFLPKTDESFADLFLEPANAKAIERVVSLINTRGKALENRGVLLMGPPGTGKTLSARIVRNQAQATFIWVSARDFHYAGSFGGFTDAFDLARECAPSVVVFEDVDNWLSDRTVDLLKTEMDGVARSSGVVTMMTTNFPEQLPEALIDRPGRFHDVLKFGLPDASARRKMLDRWLPGLAERDIVRAVAATDGYSGAHLKELARFAKIIGEQESLPIDQALSAALTKLAEQRELITATQRSGSRYRANGLTEKTGLPIQNRAYSTFEIKSVDAEQRIIQGYASTPEADRIGDVLDPKGARFKLPMPLLWQHKHDLPIGEVLEATTTDKGIWIKARIAKISEPGVVKDRLDMAWQSITSKLVRGLSIGWKPIEEIFNKTRNAFDYPKWDWYELSAVTVPMNASANIQTIKSLDVGLGLSANETVVDRESAGVPASSRAIKARTEHRMRKSYSEQIQQWEATRKAKTDRMDEILAKGSETGTTPDDAEQEEHDTLEVEVDGIDKQLVRLRSAEKRDKDAAKQVSGGDTGEAARARAGETPRIQVIEKALPPGLRFARFVLAKAAVRAQHADSATEYVKTYFPDDHALSEFTKAAVGAATTANAQGPLLQYTDIATEFIDFLRPLTILGKFGGPIPNGGGANYPDVTHVPFNIRVGTQTAGGTASWVGEGKPKPLTKGTFGTATLDFTKLACISVLTKEEVRFPSISAQTKVRDDLANAIRAQADKDFIDPANLGSAGVKPAAITANIAATPATATTAVAVAVNLNTMIKAMIAAGIQPSSLVLIMSQSLALSLSLMRTSLGVRNYPDITMMGGFLEGIPVITSEAVTSLGSPSTGMIVAVNAKDVFLADDGNVSIATSDQASLEMLDSSLLQDGTAGTGASLVSMFQNNMLAILAEREINWKLMRASAVGYISQPLYVPQ